MVAFEAVGVALGLAAPWVIGTAAGREGSASRSSGSRCRAPRPRTGARSSASPSGRRPARPSSGCWSPRRRSRWCSGGGSGCVWAARLWVAACGSWALAFAASRGDLGSFTPSESVVLAPAAARRGRLRGPGDLRLRGRPGRARVRLAPGGQRRRRSSSWRSASFRWWPARPAAAGASRPRGWSSRSPSSATPIRRAPPGSCGWATRGPCPPAGGRCSPDWPTRSPPRPCPTRRRCSPPPGPGPADARGRRRPPGRVRRHGAPGSAPGSGRRALRGGGRRLGARPWWAP